MKPQSGSTFGRAPGALPLVGHARQLLRQPLEFLGSLSAYGDLVEIQLGPKPAYVPCNPELLHHMLIHDRTFDKGGPMVDKVRDILGNGLGTCPHSDHRRARRLVQPAFTRPRLEPYSAVMQNEITAAVDSWRDGQVIDAFSTFYRVGLRIVTRSLFSAGVDDRTVNDIEQSFETTLRGIFRHMFVPRPLRQLPLPANRRYEQALGRLHTVVGRFITDVRTHKQASGGLLSVLTDSGMDDAEIHDQVVTVLLGGSETVAAALCWAFHLLEQHPSVADRLREEADAVLPGGRPAGWEDLPKLPFTRRVFTETLRVYPPAWLVTRRTTTQAEFAGRQLPAGTTLVFSPPVVQRNAAVFDHPDVFDPDRWLPERAAALPQGSFVPFGDGARKCIGDAYGTVEGILTLATVAARWHTECLPASDLRPVALAAIYHPRRLLIRLHAR